MAAVTLLRESSMTKYHAKAKAGQQTMKVREEVFDYITREAAAATRTNPGQVEHMQKLHAALKEYFGHDEIANIMATIKEWRRKAEGK
jgi:hypothetical protein